MSDDGAEFVEAGSFRVDRSRALEKLKRFQLGDPARGAFFWVRCAVASESSSIDIRPGRGAFSLRFDGRPLTRAELRDPYGALFAPDAPVRSRQLAFAMLWAMRLEPASVELSSGPPGSRLRLRARTLADGSPEDVDEGETTTTLVLRASWRETLSPPWPRAAADYAAACAMCPARLLVDGRTVPAEGAPDPWGLSFTVDGARVLLTTQEDPWRRPARSVASLSLCGVHAGEVEYPRRFIAAAARIDLPDLALDASQSAVVRDGRLDAVLEAVAARERELLIRVLDGVPAAAAACARAAALALLDDPRTDRRDPLLARLWDAPLFGERGGDARSLADLLAMPPLPGAATAERRALAAFLDRVADRHAP